MIFKIKTSKKTMNIFEQIESSTKYAPFILAKLAIAASLKSGKPLEETDFNTDSLGLELNRQTITGEWDALFKNLVIMFEGSYIVEEDYFPKYLKAHLDRGAKLLYAEFQYSNDFLLGLLSTESGI